MRQYLLMVFCCFACITVKSQLIVTNIGTGSSTNIPTYPGFNNTGLTPAVFGGTGTIVTTNPSTGYPGASGASNVRIDQDKDFWISFNTGSNLLLSFSFAYMTSGGNLLSDPILEYSILPGVFLPLNLLSFNSSSSWIRINTSPLVVLPNTNIVLRWRTSAPFSSNYQLRVDDINFANPTVLPMAVPNLTGSIQSNGTVLSWSVDSKNKDGQIALERSQSAEAAFETINSIYLNESDKSNFTYTDKGSLQKTNYYRLKYTSGNGNSSYSNTVRIMRNPDVFSISAVYPNPLRGSDLRFTLTDSKGSETDLLVTDLSGNLIKRQKIETRAGDNACSITLGQLRSGIYILQIRNGEHLILKQFVKD